MYGKATLPPTQNCLNLHFQRASYQAGIYRRCLQQNIFTPPPEHHGWQLVDGKVCINWVSISIPAVPPEFTELVECYCKGGCIDQRCSCKKISLDVLVSADVKTATTKILKIIKSNIYTLSNILLLIHAFARDHYYAILLQM